MTKTTIALVALVLGVGTVHAQPATDDQKKAQAKAYYEQGLSAYNLGRFNEAIEAFTKAYEVSQAPGLLFNIAQSHRLNKDYEKASYFYATYLRLKPDAPNRSDVEQRIQEMDKAIEDQKKISAGPPTGVVQPEGGVSSGKPAITTTTTTTTVAGGTGTGPATTGTATTTTGALDGRDGMQDDGGLTKTGEPTAPKLLRVRFTGGVALLKSSDLDIPVQPAIGLTAAYPLALGTITLELGAGFSWTPLPYETAAGQQRGRMIGARAIAAAVYSATPKVLLRGEVGAGIVSLGGLTEGNPIADMRQAASFTRPNFRFGVSADYLITPNFTAYVSPFAIGVSSASADMYGSLREINVLVGVGYQQ
jgi:hypothetical protein